MSFINSNAFDGNLFFAFKDCFMRLLKERSPANLYDTWCTSWTTLSSLTVLLQRLQLAHSLQCRLMGSR